MQDRSTRATLNRKLLIRVAPYFMGCTVKMRKFRPNLVHPLMVQAAGRGAGACQCAARSCLWAEGLQSAFRSPHFQSIQGGCNREGATGKAPQAVL